LAPLIFNRPAGEWPCVAVMLRLARLLAVVF
jgi:hypothetical protein